ncbi:MAG TPA: hypothetical protein VFQ61_23530 [Polyangiaceae bacterium]|nr:hypothetical protein [Polyangiaceae bacterium]
MKPRYYRSDSLITDMCDADAHWGPLLFLRPAQDERFDWRRQALFALIVGTALGGLGSVILGVLARVFGRAPDIAYSFPLVLTLVYFAACVGVVAPAWNRRAMRLARLRTYR